MRIPVGESVQTFLGFVPGHAQALQHVPREGDGSLEFGLNHFRRSVLRKDRTVPEVVGSHQDRDFVVDLFQPPHDEACLLEVRDGNDGQPRSLRAHVT
jgi:hypothetical protein